MMKFGLPKSGFGADLALAAAAAKDGSSPDPTVRPGRPERRVSAGLQLFPRPLSNR
jgi:hypothetical protein